jgi:hypothetical protein
MQKFFYPTIFKYLLIPPSGFYRSRKGRGGTYGMNKELCVKLLLKAETRKEIISRII